MKRIANLVLLTAACFLAGCSTTKESKTSEMRRGMKQQMNAVRAQLQTSGASAARLREFDRVAAAMDRQMRQLERQMHAMEATDAR